jgi:hypothetical protein
LQWTKKRPTKHNLARSDHSYSVFLFLKNTA